jgi:hypothetical protein
MDNEDFCSSVTMKRIGTTCRLACAADIKTGCLLDVDILLGILRDPATDDGIVLFAFCPRVVSIDESGSTRNKLCEFDLLNFSCHQINSDLLVLFFKSTHLILLYPMEKEREGLSPSLSTSSTAAGYLRDTLPL